jgi:hypothetical protein
VRTSIFQKRASLLQHGYLLLLVHDGVPGSVGLEVEGHLAANVRQVGQEVAGRPVASQNLAQSLRQRSKFWKAIRKKWRLNNGKL